MNIDFNKNGGLVPAIVQDADTLEVLMLGYMNEEAYKKSCKENKITFFSRSRQMLWTKGESSGNFLEIKSIHLDCDQDTLLILATAEGPTCHTGARSCFNTPYSTNFIFKLEKIIADRSMCPVKGSYINKLQNKGLNKITQKVGEEAVETVIAALAESKEDLINESADLIFHLLILLNEKEVQLKDIANTLASRNN